MNDLISRKAVLELPRNTVRNFFGEAISETVDVKLIEALPTIEPRKGKWIYNKERGTAKIWTCSECRWNDIGEWNFCPNCGADMREEGDNEP